MAGGGGIVLIPWYATLFRGDSLAAALPEIVPVAARYGAFEYELLRSRDDSYRFLQVARFADKLDFTRYWEGPELVRFRARYSGWYQVPVLYEWNDRLVNGAIQAADIVAVPSSATAAQA